MTKIIRTITSTLIARLWYNKVRFHVLCPAYMTKRIRTITSTLIASLRHNKVNCLFPYPTTAQRKRRPEDRRELLPPPSCRVSPWLATVRLLSVLVWTGQHSRVAAEVCLARFAINTSATTEYRHSRFANSCLSRDSSVGRAEDCRGKNQTLVSKSLCHW